MALTPKQERFVQCIIEGKTQYEAYKTAYPTSKKWERNSIDCEAGKLMADTKILQRLEELRKPIIKKCQMTAEDLIRDLEKAKTMALNSEQISPYINAVMGQAKLLGLDKQVIEGAINVVTMAMVKKDGKPLEYNIGKGLKK